MGSLITLKHIMTIERACKELGIRIEAFVELVKNEIFEPLIVRQVIPEESGEQTYLCENFFGHEDGYHPQRQYFNWDCYRYKGIYFDCRDIQYYIEHSDCVVETGACAPLDESYVPRWASNNTREWYTVNQSSLWSKQNVPNKNTKARDDFKEGTPAYFVNEMRINGASNYEIALKLQEKGYTQIEIGMLIFNDGVERQPETYAKKIQRLFDKKEG